MPTRKRTGYTARTAKDLTHVNRLYAPEFTILNFRLSLGGKNSKSYLPPDQPQPSNPDTGVDTFHFVPEKESPNIQFEIDDTRAQIRTAKLELFRRFSEPALWTLDLAKVGPDSFLHGKHSLKWDGRVIKNPTAIQAGVKSDSGISHDLTAFTEDTTIQADFSDGYITLNRTPYKLRLTVTDGENNGASSRAWTYFQILIKKIELELGPVEAIPTGGVPAWRQAMDRALYQVILNDGGVPATGDTRKVYLISNLYKTDPAQKNTNHAFTIYQAVWSDGPSIPIFAKIRLAAHDDTEVKLEDGPGAKALGKTKFLWDWEDVAETVNSHESQAAPIAFINHAIDYYKNGTDATRIAKDHTYPKGDNCHVDRGGKRGPDAVAVFPVQTGYAAPKAALDETGFPFKVEACTNRKWAAYSYGWTKELLKGKTGVLFRPSRMAGDAYKVSVYLANETKWDTQEVVIVDNRDEPLKTAVVTKASTGAWEIWRELHVTRYIRKKMTIAEFVAANLGAFQALYNQAFIEIVNKMQNADIYEQPTAGYNVLASGALTAGGDALVTDESCVATAADHASSASTFLTRDFAGFVTSVVNWFANNNPLDPNPAGTARTWLNNEDLTTKLKYTNRLKAICTGPAIEVVKGLDTLNGARNGISVIQFDHMASMQAAYVATAGVSEPPGMDMTNGAALDVPGNSAQKCCFALWNPRVDTFVHEIGHHLFLPHSKYPLNSPPAGYQENRHDDVDAGCIMGYQLPRPAFCGLCQLRLRGWSADALDKISANNKKP